MTEPARYHADGILLGTYTWQRLASPDYPGQCHDPDCDRSHVEVSLRSSKNSGRFAKPKVSIDGRDISARQPMSAPHPETHERVDVTILSVRTEKRRNGVRVAAEVLYDNPHSFQNETWHEVLHLGLIDAQREADTNSIAFTRRGPLEPIPLEYLDATGQILHQYRNEFFTDNDLIIEGRVATSATLHS